MNERGNDTCAFTLWLCLVLLVCGDCLNSCLFYFGGGEVMVKRKHKNINSTYGVLGRELFQEEEIKDRSKTYTQES